MKKKLIGLVTSILFITVAFSAISIAENDEIAPSDEPNNMHDVDWWPMFHHDPEHSGYSSSNTIDDNEPWWSRGIGSSIWSSPTVDTGRVFFGSNDYKVYCLDAETGEKLWNYTTGSIVGESSPKVVDNKVYIGSHDGKLYCFDAINGTVIWSYQTGDHILGSPSVDNGRVYVGSKDYNLYCFDSDPSDGIDEGFDDPDEVNYDLLWNYTGIGGITGHTVVEYGNVYFGGTGDPTATGRLYCLNATTGEELWACGFSEPANALPTIGYGMIYILNGGAMYCLDAFNGSGIWRLNSVGCEGGSFLFDDKIYVGSNAYVTSYLSCLDAYGNDNGTTDIIWEYPIKVISSPIVADGLVYALSELDNFLYCLYAENGTFYTKFDVGVDIGPNQRRSNPTIINDKIYVGAGKYLYCINIDTEDTLWKYTTGGRFGHSSPIIITKELYTGGEIYICTDEGWIYMVNALSGDTFNGYKTQGPIESSPAVHNENLLVGSNDHNLYCLRKNYFNKIWNYTTNGPVKSSPVVSDNRVYFGSNDNNIYCLDAHTGGYEWSYTTQGSVESSPAIANNKLYVGSSDHNIYCLDAVDGSYEWSYTTQGPVESSPAIAYGKVYFGSNDNNIYCLDADTGGYEWSYTTQGPVESSPAIANDRIYIGSNDHFFYCFNATAGDKVWDYLTEGEIKSSPAIANDNVYLGSNDKTISVFGDLNERPDPPSIFGPENLEVDEEGWYIFSGYDFNNDDLYYYIDFGDGYVEEWIGPYPPIEMVNIFHSWNKTGYFTIRAKAKDDPNGDGDLSDGLESDWSEFEVTIGYPQPDLSIESISGGKGVTTIIKNIGNIDLTDIEWNMLINGGIFVYIREATEVIPSLAVGESEEITMSVFGVGLGIFTDMPKITVTAECTEGSTAQGNETAMIIFSRVII